MKMEKFASAKMDVNEIISKFRDLWTILKETTLDGQMDFDVDNFLTFR